MVELPGNMNFRNITLKLFRTSQLLSIDTLPIYYPRGLLRHGSPFGCHPFQVRNTPYSDDIITTNCQHASVSTIYVRIDIWISTIFYMEASKTISIFCDPVCSRSLCTHSTAYCEAYQSITGFGLVFIYCNQNNNNVTPDPTDIFRNSDKNR